MANIRPASAKLSCEVGKISGESGFILCELTSDMSSKWNVNPISTQTA